MAEAGKWVTSALGSDDRVGKLYSQTGGRLVQSL
jgi:hypothetical protein